MHPPPVPRSKLRRTTRIRSRRAPVPGSTVTPSGGAGERGSGRRHVEANAALCGGPGVIISSPGAIGVLELDIDQQQRYESEFQLMIDDTG
jgi:hypothetical protein